MTALCFLDKLLANAGGSSTTISNCSVSSLKDFITSTAMPSWVWPFLSFINAMFSLARLMAVLLISALTTFDAPPARAATENPPV